jgi:hypothetical protein
MCDMVALKGKSIYAGHKFRGNDVRRQAPFLIPGVKLRGQGGSILVNVICGLIYLMNQWLCRESVGFENLAASALGY